MQYNKILSATLVTLLVILAGGVVMAQTKSKVEASNKALVRERFEAWKAGSGSPFDLLADDSTWTIAGNSLASRTYVGREVFLAEVIRPFNARMRVGLKPTILDLVADGDLVVVHFDASGMARDGVAYTNTYAWFLNFRDGKISRATAFFDALAFNELWTRVKP